ncbi:MAG: hypothetical protein ABL888_09805 [Pirellulaceae bacterium]
MAIPVSQWSDQDWTRDRIDRFFQRQNYRLSGGVQLQADYASLIGALGVFQGRGKYLQLKQVAFAQVDLPNSLQDELVKLHRAESPNLGMILAVGRDLVAYQSQTVEKLQRLAGKFVDRILAVTLDCDGIYQQDFDGQSTRVSYYRALEIAERTGANVIDGIGERDLAANGSGQWLAALPSWLIHADREQSPDSGNKLLLFARNGVEAMILPNSDGSDDFVPEIQVNRFADLLSDCDDILNFVEASSGNQRVVETILIGFPSAQIEDFVLKGQLKSGLLGICRIPENISSVEMHDAVVSAFWGIMFADQMAGNLPLLTGASSQRILGRISPGLPVVWRHLLQNMNDATAPTMKLRDAV